MNLDLAMFYPALPEITLLVMACAVLLIDLFLRDDQRGISYGLTQLTLLGAAILAAWVARPEPQVLLHGHYIRDAMGDVLKVFLFAIALLTFIYSKGYLRRQGLLKGEYWHEFDDAGIKIVRL